MKDYTISIDELSFLSRAVDAYGTGMRCEFAMNPRYVMFD